MGNVAIIWRCWREHARIIQPERFAAVCCRSEEKRAALLIALSMAQGASNKWLVRLCWSAWHEMHQRQQFKENTQFHDEVDWSTIWTRLRKLKVEYCLQMLCV